MQDLTMELNQLRQDLNNAIKEIRERGQAKSIAERDYRVALATNILVLRDNKIPVTIIKQNKRAYCLGSAYFFNKFSSAS